MARLFFVLFLIVVAFFIYLKGGISAIQGAKGSRIMVENYMERVERMVNK